MYLLERISLNKSLNWNTKLNKVRFIHFRNVTNPNARGEQTLLIKGGATVAWCFDDSGDIRVGAPALCSKNDNYRKGTGRLIAEDNLNNKPLALVVPKQEYLNVINSEIDTFNQMRYITKQFRQDLINVAKAAVADDPLDFVNISWFEQKLRQAVVFNGDENRVYTANGQVYGK
jgi:hypothetical protein